MSHFTECEWLEFVRGMASLERKTLMESHLDKGCLKCKGRADSWRLVIEVLRGATSDEPPADVVRLMKASFLTNRTWRRNVGRTFALLTFDSFLQPLAAGVRGASEPVRQLMYEAGSLVIDLRIESASAKDRVRFIGQVLDSKNPEQLLENVEVVIEDADEPFPGTRTNESGEFIIELDRATSHQLLIKLPERTPVQINVP